MTRKIGKRRASPRSPAAATGKDQPLPDVCSADLPRESEGEDRAAYEQLFAQYYERFRPTGAAERFLVDDLIHCAWSIRRFQRLELEDGDLGSEWQSLLTVKHAAYGSVLSALRRYRTNARSQSKLPDSSLKTTIH
jgi:hypothetical protein